MDRRGKTQKGFSMTSRRPIRDAVGSPGPARYAPEKAINTTVSLNPPAYSLGARDLKQNSNTNPGPNAYHIIDNFGCFHFLSSNRNCPGVKLGIKHKVSNTDKNPGPGSYNAVDTNVIKPSPPSYSVTPKSYR